MGRKKKTCPGRVKKKKTYPHIEEGSLCHRPSNCNLSNLCGLYKRLAPEIVSWFLRFAESLAPPANSCAFGARASRSIFLTPPALVFGVNCLEPSLWQRLWRGKKYTWDLSYSEGRREATLKRRVSFWSVTMTFPSKVQPAGGYFELQTLYGACRIFVLKSSKSQDILVKISYSEGRREATLKRRVSFWSVTMTFPSKVQPAGGYFELQTLYGACRIFVLKSSKSQDILVKISYSEGRREATLKRRVSFWSVTMTFPSKVQPAGGYFELQTLYGACRVFVLKSSKSQDILVKIGCFTQNGDLSNTHTPTPAHIHKFKFGFLHFGAVVRFV